MNHEPVLYCAYDKYDETPLKEREVKIVAKPPQKKSKKKTAKELRRKKRKQNKVATRNVLKLIDSL